MGILVKMPEGVNSISISGELFEVKDGFAEMPNIAALQHVVESFGGEIVDGPAPVVAEEKPQPPKKGKK